MQSYSHTKYYFEFLIEPLNIHRSCFNLVLRVLCLAFRKGGNPENEAAIVYLMRTVNTSSYLLPNDVRPI